MAHRKKTTPGGITTLFGTLLTNCLLLIGSQFSTYAQTATLSVTNFGARGDAVQFLASTVSNSATITIQSTNRLSTSDVGKLVLLFGGGPATTATNNQDLVGQIVQVVNGTNLTLSVHAGLTTNQVTGIYGTQNAGSFQQCINACTGTNTVVTIPSGRYLLISPQVLDPNFVMQNEFETHQAVTIQKGGIHFLGADRDSTVLLGCGAWQIKGAYAYRGFIFACQGPVTNDAPLIFDNLTMDGGVATGNMSYHGFPAMTTDGSGWDVTHDAILDIGTPPLHAFKSFRNCAFTHWRGEILKSVAPLTDGFIEVTNCLFSDANASCFNFSFTHDINGCTFSNVQEVAEFYEAYASNACSLRNCLITNVSGGVLAINGALTNHVPPQYTITSNLISVLQKGNGIMTTPAQNVSITGNKFFDAGTAIALGVSGYQGTAVNSNITVAFNQFYNCDFPVQVEGAGVNSVINVAVYSNSAISGAWFAYGYGWSTNVVFTQNEATGMAGGLNSTTLSGQFYVDDTSNHFPPHQFLDVTGQTNTISYTYGMRHQIWVNVTNAKFVLDDSHASQIPSGAALTITHTGNYPVPLYLSLAMNTTPTWVSNGFTVQCQWTNGVWNLLSLSKPPLPPTDLHVLGP
jgi:hypothetical protein